MLEQLPPQDSGVGSMNPLTTLKNHINHTPSALDHSNEGDEPGSAFIKSNEQRILSGLSPLEANIVKRNKNMAGTLGGMNLNNNIAFTGTIGRNDWLAESPKNRGGRAATNHLIPMDEKGSSNDPKDPS